MNVCFCRQQTSSEGWEEIEDKILPFRTVTATNEGKLQKIMKVYAKTEGWAFEWSPIWWTITGRQQDKFGPWKFHLGTKGQPEEPFFWYHWAAHRSTRLVHKCHHMWRNMNYLVWPGNKTVNDALEDSKNGKVLIRNTKLKTVPFFGISGAIMIQ